MYGYIQKIRGKSNGYLHISRTVINKIFENTEKYRKIKNCKILYNNNKFFIKI